MVNKRFTIARIFIFKKGVGSDPVVAGPRCSLKKLSRVCDPVP